MNEKRKSPFRFMICGAIFLFFVNLHFINPTRAAGDEVVVANASIPGGQLSKDEVKDVFLGIKSTIGGEVVVLATLKQGDAHEGFLKDVVGKTPSQYLNYWKRQVFTGKGKMPQAFDSEKELLAFVAATKGAVGYAGGAAAADPRVAGGSLKVIPVTE